MLSALAVLAAAVACSSKTSDVNAQPTPSSSVYTDVFCDAYHKKLVQWGSAFLNAGIAIADPSSDAGKVQQAITDVREALIELRSWLDAHAAGIADSRVASAVEASRAALAQPVTELDAAGHDGEKILSVITGESFATAHRKVGEACRPPSP